MNEFWIFLTQHNCENYFKNRHDPYHDMRSFPCVTRVLCYLNLDKGEFL